MGAILKNIRNIIKKEKSSPNKKTGQVSFCRSALHLLQMKMYWRSPSCGVSGTHNVHGWGRGCSKVRARGERAPKAGAEKVPRGHPSFL